MLCMMMLFMTLEVHSNLMSGFYTSPTCSCCYSHTPFIPIHSYPCTFGQYIQTSLDHHYHFHSKLSAKCQHYDLGIFVRMMYLILPLAIGYTSLEVITETTILVSYLKSSHCNSFKDRSTGDDYMVGYQEIMSCQVTWNVNKAKIFFIPPSAILVLGY